MKRLLWIVCALLASGCLERELVSLNPCLVSGVAAKINAQSITKVDLLFVVDNSQSMLEEQESLKREFPTLIKTLTSGTRSDGTTFPPVKDLHLGVVSTDMGLAGIANPFDCDPNRGGDDGKLLNTGRGTNCAASYPKFLTFELGTSVPDDVARDFACIATLGTEGCGFEMQLEAGLKALWPKAYIDQDGDVYPSDKNPITFLSTTPEGRFGHGDGVNAGFLRNGGDNADVSLVAIVLVSDEEDCSSIKTDHFTTDPAKPVSAEPLNLRCFNHKENLFPVKRYIDGFKLLRPDQEHLVIFAAIVGVPVDLVDADARKRFNDLETTADREAYYEAMLNDMRMQETPDDSTGRDRNLVPSCSGDTKDATAYPPVRIVEVARGFGVNGVVQSICQKDFGPAMDLIINAITDRLVAVCLPKPLIRKADGTVPCNVIWELPPAKDAAAGTPTNCGGDYPHLEPVDQGRPPTNSRGGNNCKVKQLPVERRGTVPEGLGWYYDDFAPELKQQCRGTPQRVSFTEASKPENGVVVKLECVNETQRLPSSDPRRMPKQPDIGTACGEASDPNAAADAPVEDCVVDFKDGTEDRGMFCHPELNVCVRGCQGSSECPAAWVCDTRSDIKSKAGGKAFCVNPTCGSD